MVDISDLGQINALYQRLGEFERAIQYLTEAGRIVSMTIESGDQTLAMSVAIVTTDISYPEGMAEAIKAALTDRIHKIEDELAGMGVTGVAGR